MPWPKGKSRTKAQNEKTRLSMLGKNTAPKTLGAKIKMSIAKQGVYTDEKHPAWKGEKASYRAIHQWIVRKLGQPKKCDHCGKGNLTGHKIHWANISGNYLRLISDWVRLCPKCHRKFDTGRRKPIRKTILT